VQKSIKIELIDIGEVVGLVYRCWLVGQRHRSLMPHA